VNVLRSALALPSFAVYAVGAFVAVDAVMIFWKWCWYIGYMLSNTGLRASTKSQRV